MAIRCVGTGIRCNALCLGLTITSLSNKSEEEDDRMGQTPNSHLHLEAMETGQDKIYQAPGIRSTGRAGVAMGKHTQGLLEVIQQPHPENDIDKRTPLKSWIRELL
jgi:hypothetical protein